MSIIYTCPQDVEVRGTIIAFHGGCFVGGDVTWDKDQNEALARLGYHVLQLKLPKTLKAWRKNVSHMCMNILCDCPEPFFVLGRSSGGYLAKELKERWIRIKKAIYICPVFNPLHRAMKLPKFAAKTQLFFPNSQPGKFCPNMFIYDDDPIDTSKTTADELILLADQDENVPTSCFTKAQLDQAVHLGVKTHSAMCKTTSKAFLNLVATHFVVDNKRMHKTT